MANFLVTNDNDAGAGSLRQAIIDAGNLAGADTIDFDPNVFDETQITLTSGELLIQAGNDLTINGDTDGDGDFDVVIRGDSDGSNSPTAGDSNHFQIAAGAVVTLNSLALVYGADMGIGHTDASPMAGSIVNFGTLTINNSVFFNNTANYGNNAARSAAGASGAIAVGHIYSAGTLTINDTHMSGGTAYGGRGGTGTTNNGFLGIGGTGGRGGAAVGGIISTGTLTTNRLQIDTSYGSGGTGGTGGAAPSGTGGIGGQGGAGIGAIYAAGTISGTIENGFSGGGAGVGGAGGIGGFFNGIGGASGLAFAGIYDAAAGSFTAVTNLGTREEDGQVGIVGAFYGMGGHDTLTAGGVAQLHGGTGHDILTAGSGSSAFGGRGDDILINTFVNGGTWDGGSGIDTLDVSQDITLLAQTFDLSAVSFSFYDATFSNFENVTASAGNDIITGNNLANILNGGLGDDTIQGGDGADTLDGGGNTAVGDTLSYTLSSFGVNVNLATGAASGSGSGAAGDVISNFENLTGSLGSDTLTGDAGNNVLLGLDGNDTIEGGLGNDVMTGGLDFSTGDTVSFAGFAATIGTQGITIDLANAAQQNTGAGLDTISGFENVTGSAFDDTITESSVRNTLNGGNGNDVIIINGTLADVAGEVIDGGGGTDTLRFTGTGNLTHNLRNDTVTSIEALQLVDAGPFNTRTILLNANQFGGTGISLTTAINFDAFNDTNEIIDIQMGTETILDLPGLTFSGDTSDARFVITGDGDGEDITGTSVRDTINGEGGDDTIQGGAAGDTLDGGTHGLYGDTLSYALSNEAVIVDIGSGFTSGGHAQFDIISNFENLTGSGHDDILQGSSGANVINGGNGDDTIQGGLGNDVLNGGGNSVSGDTLNFSAFVATVGTQGVTVDLRNTGQQNTGAGLDTFIDFENVTGSHFDDVLIEGEGRTGLNGGLGNDVLVLDGAIADASSESLAGDEGVDTLRFIGNGVHSHDLRNDSVSSIEVLQLEAGTFRQVNLYASQFSNTGIALNATVALDALLGSSALIIVQLQAESRFDLSNLVFTGNTGSTSFSINGVGAEETLIGTSITDFINAGGGNDILEGGGGNDILSGNSENDIVRGGSGIDEVFYNSSAGPTVSFNALSNAYTISGGEDGSDVVTGIENFTFVTGGFTTATVVLTGPNVVTGSGTANTLFGTLGMDVYQGLGGDDTFISGWGADQMEGGIGIDTAYYYDSVQGVIANLVTNLGSYGEAEGDSYNSIENVIGSNTGGDTLTGGDENNFFNGFGGADTLTGAGGGDSLFGGDGDDLIRPGAGFDYVVGGNNIDTADYSSSLVGVGVHLFFGGGFAGDAIGDGIVGIENIIGSATAGDTIYGDDGANILQGLGGDDIIHGSLGNDVMDGGAGAADTAYYFLSAGPITVNLSGGVGVGGNAQGDTFIGIENVIGTQFGGDTLTGNNDSNFINGYGGADIINGGLGNDSLAGGVDSDVFRFTDVNFGFDYIGDWQDGFDTISIAASVAVDMTTVFLTQINASQWFVNIGTAGITVNSASAFTLDSGDFVFV